MKKIADVIKARNVKLTPEELDGVKSRLIFAGLSEDLSEPDVATASGLIDKIVEKMRQSKQNMSDYVEQTSTLPKLEMFSDTVEAASDVMVALVNGRIATFNSKNNVVTPSKKATTK